MSSLCALVLGSAALLLVAVAARAGAPGAIDPSQVVNDWL